MTMVVKHGSRIGIRDVLTSMILNLFLYVVEIVSAAQTAGDYTVLNEDGHTSSQQVERLVNEILGKVYTNLHKKNAHWCVGKYFFNNALGFSMRKCITLKGINLRISAKTAGIPTCIYEMRRRWIRTQ